MFRGNNHRPSPMMVKFQAYHQPIVVAMILIRLLFVKDLQLRAINFSRVENFSVNSSALLHVETNRSTSCRRPCEKRINKIIFTADNAAGLRDRQVVLTLLADLAGYLCAVVEFPPPTKMLAPKHNDDMKSDPKIVWTDYWNITFIDNAQPSVRTLPVINGNRGSNTKYSKLGDEDYKEWYHVLTRTAEEVYHDFEKIERASWEFSDPGFVWEIRVHWYPETRKVMRDGLKARDQSYPEWKMLPPDPKYPLGPSCTYIKEEVPHHVQNIVDDVKLLIENQSPPNATIGYFHVRRGDSMSGCDTSLARMTSYLQCTFQGLEKDRREITILFFSDDRNKKYRFGIQKIVEELEPAGRVKFIDLDKLVWGRLQQAEAEAEVEAYLVDNNYIFEVTEVLKEQFGSFYLEQRRHLNCNDCDIV